MNGIRSRMRLCWLAIFLSVIAVAGCAPATSDQGGSPGRTGGGGQGGSGGTPGSTGGSAGSFAGSGGFAGTSAGGSANQLDAGISADTGSDASGPLSDAGSDAPFPPGPHTVVLLVGDIHLTDPSRLQLIEILNSMKDSHGIVVEVMDSRVATASVLMDKALVIAGPNNNYCSDTPDPSLKSLPVPIIVSRDCKTTAFGLGTMMNTQEYITDLPVKITIVNGNHPLAAGLLGEVPVLQTRCRLVRGGNLGPDAIKIAKPPTDAIPVDPDSWAIFAYDKGGRMVDGFKAPAKRMGFFWHRPSAVTPEGKKLFQAAVEWAIRP